MIREIIRFELDSVFSTYGMDEYIVNLKLEQTQPSYYIYIYIRKIINLSVVSKEKERKKKIVRRFYVLRHRVLNSLKLILKRCLSNKFAKHREKNNGNRGKRRKREGKKVE